MALDQAIFDLHDLDQVHLVAVRRGPRIFPGEHTTVGEEALLEAFALRRIGLKYPGDESAQLFLALNDPFLRIHQMLHQWAFDRGVVRVERERGFKVLLAQSVVPKLVDARGVLHGRSPGCVDVSPPRRETLRVVSPISEMSPAQMRL